MDASRLDRWRPSRQHSQIWQDAARLGGIWRQLETIQALWIDDGDPFGLAHPVDRVRCTGV
jgi:hypothetical protein